MIWCGPMVGWWHIMFKRQQPRRQLTLRKGYWRTKVGSLPTPLFLALPDGVLVPRNDLARVPGIDLNPRLSKSNARESCLAQATFCNKLWTKQPIHTYYQLKQHIPTVRSPHTTKWMATWTVHVGTQATNSRFETHEWMSPMHCSHPIKMVHSHTSYSLLDPLGVWQPQTFFLR
jgi:hypothetical protein